MRVFLVWAGAAAHPKVRATASNILFMKEPPQHHSMLLQKAGVGNPRRTGTGPRAVFNRPMRAGESRLPPGGISGLPNRRESAARGRAPTSWRTTRQRFPLADYTAGALRP